MAKPGMVKVEVGDDWAVVESKEIVRLLEDEGAELQYVDYYVSDMWGYIKNGKIEIEDYNDVFKMYGTYTDEIEVAPFVDREAVADRIFEEACDISEKVYDRLYDIIEEALKRQKKAKQKRKK